MYPRPAAVSSKNSPHLLFNSATSPSTARAWQAALQRAVHSTTDGTAKSYPHSRVSRHAASMGSEPPKGDEREGDASLQYMSPVLVTNCLHHALPAISWGRWCVTVVVGIREAYVSVCNIIRSRMHTDFVSTIGCPAAPLSPACSLAAAAIPLYSPVPKGRYQC